MGAKPVGSDPDDPRINPCSALREEQLGFTGTSWREGFVMYDGTIIVFYAWPGMDGDAYYTRKCNYGLNTQVSD